MFDENHTSGKKLADVNPHLLNTTSPIVAEDPPRPDPEDTPVITTVKPSIAIKINKANSWKPTDKSAEIPVIPAPPAIPAAFIPFSI